MADERLTHSKRSCFLFCARQFYWRYERSLELAVQRPGRRRGSIFGDALRAARGAVEEHAVAVQDTAEEDVELHPFAPQAAAMAYIDEAYVEHFDHISTPEEVAELELERRKIRVMVRLYLERYGLRARREVEYELSYRNPASGGFSKTWKVAGMMDGLVVVGPKRGRLIEDKFVGQIQQAMIDRLPLDSQTTEYVFALASKGWDAEVDFRYTLYPQINPKKGKDAPLLTPSGKPSHAKSVPAESLDEFEERLEADVRERDSEPQIQRPGQGDRGGGVPEESDTVLRVRGMRLYPLVCGASGRGVALRGDQPGRGAERKKGRRVMCDEDEVDEVRDLLERDEALGGAAARQLVTAHRSQYERLIADAEHEKEVARLQSMVDKQTREIKRLEKLNPDGVNVPPLQETMATLMRERTAQHA